MTIRLRALLLALGWWGAAVVCMLPLRADLDRNRYMAMANQRQRERYMWLAAPCREGNWMVMGREAWFCVSDSVFAPPVWRRAE